MRTIYLGHNPLYAAVCQEESDLAAVFWHDCKGNMAERAAELVEYCRKNRIVSIHHSRLDGLIKRIMAACQPELIVVGEYHNLLKQDVIDIATVATINMHGSPLPRYRGAHPINWMIINGENEGAVSCHYVTEGLDSGDIIGQYKFPIFAYDTAFDVRPRIEETGSRLLRDVLRRFRNEGKIEGIPQDTENASYFPPRKPEDGIINWNMPAINIYNFIRALTRPYPGAFTFIDKYKVNIWRAEYPLNDDSVCPGIQLPGTIITRDNGRLAVASGDGRRLVITDWDPGDVTISEGKRFEDR